MRTNPPTKRRVAIVAAVTFGALLVAIVCGLVIGPTSIPTWRLVGELFAHVGIGHNTLTPLQWDVVWQIRGPRMVIGLLAGSMLAVAGGTYQGVFRNPLADPYLLGVAAGAGLGATFAIIDISHGVGTPTWTPLLAFVGAMGAVIVTWLIGGRSMRSNTATLILAGVAVASLLTSAQTFLQQQSSANSITRVYIWLLGSLASAGWGTVWLVFPYVIVCIIICVGAGRALDVMSVGEDESRSLGVPVRRVRFVVIAASSLGTAAIVSAVGLVGFVGIIVPHIVRLLVGTSYRRILPISVIFGAAFLVFADTVARTVIAPSELPLGVVTALIGAPVFVIILSLRRPVAV
ncbi:MAG TPA: iron ABC transporter permease [Acidimicrobiales bacterium]|nr:iron ABC transporter permease [Acidimicrobiales bacterium]